MPWGRKPPPPAGSSRFERPDADARQETSIEALQGGHLPAEATDRLGRQNAGQLPWTSTLTVPDFLVVRHLGLKPLGQVMGSSVMHIGFNPQWVYGAWQNGDVRAVSRAMTEARELALERLRQEAAALGAHGVVDVRLKGVHPHWGDKLVEFQATGTAVSLPGEPLPKQIFLGQVSAEDTEKLWDAGYLPMNVVLSTTAYYVLTDWVSNRQQMSWANVEIESFSRAIYEARAFVVGGMRAAARDVGADGVLGAEWSMEVEEFEVERPAYGMGWGGGYGMGGMGGYGEVQEMEFTDHILYMTVMGTAIGRMNKARPHDPPAPAVSLYDPPISIEETGPDLTSGGEH
jgi:uncharacterized protein YbjQ (UPF0145 family)